MKTSAPSRPSDIKRLLRAYVSASRRYNTDCNRRRVPDTDETRALLSRRSDAAFCRLIRAVTRLPGMSNNGTDPMLKGMGDRD